MSAATVDPVHAAAFSGVYLLPGAVEADAPVAGGTDALLRAFTTEQRDRVFNIALRRLAFQLLYELDQSAAGRSAEAVDMAAVRERVKASLGGVPDIGPVHAEAVMGLVAGAFEGRSAADAAFLAIAPEWPTHRLAAVDRALLRLAHYEMTSGRTPGKIVVNEAVELAKHFSTEKSPAFINALLDKVHKGGNEDKGDPSGNIDAVTKVHTLSSSDAVDVHVRSTNPPPGPLPPGGGAR